MAAPIAVTVSLDKYERDLLKKFLEKSKTTADGANTISATLPVSHALRSTAQAVTKATRASSDVPRDTAAHSRSENASAQPKATHGAASGSLNTSLFEQLIQTTKDKKKNIDDASQTAYEQHAEERRNMKHVYHMCPFCKWFGAFDKFKANNKCPNCGKDVKTGYTDMRNKASGAVQKVDEEMTEAQKDKHNTTLSALPTSLSTPLLLRF